MKTKEIVIRLISGIIFGTIGYLLITGIISFKKRPPSGEQVTQEVVQTETIETISAEAAFSNAVAAEEVKLIKVTIGLDAQMDGEQSFARPSSNAVSVFAKPDWFIEQQNKSTNK